MSNTHILYKLRNNKDDFEEFWLFPCEIPIEQIKLFYKLFMMSHNNSFEEYMEEWYEEIECSREYLIELNL